MEKIIRYFDKIVFFTLRKAINPTSPPTPCLVKNYKDVQAY